ncbi:phage tail protein I [bacterium D16-50]|nr:phage tail protein I [bacterium D16-50]
MTRLQDSQITQILPEYLSEKASVQALSFALNRAVRKLIGYCGNIGVFSAIDVAADSVLDMLALELNVPYYDDSLKTETKREMVKNMFNWHMTAGTPAAVEDLVSSVFGQGEIHEWFEYGGEPYTFRIITNADAAIESIKEFEKLIERVKNIRSHIDEVIFIREQQARMYVSVVNIARMRTRVGWEAWHGDI